MLDLLTRGGPLIWPLLACGFVALGIFLERYFHFHRAALHVPEFLTGINRLITEKRFAEAAHECAGTPGPVARVVHAAVSRPDAPASDLRIFVQETGQLELPRLERYLPVLSTIAYIAPLLGLFGTLTGLLVTFESITDVNGFATPVQISKGVYQSLISSALGLAIAIPVYLLYSYLAAASRGLMNDMERAGIEVVQMMEDSRNDRNIISFDVALSKPTSATVTDADDESPEPEALPDEPKITELPIAATKKSQTRR